MATLAQPIPQRTYVFVANKAAVGDQVNKEFDTLYNVLQGGVGDAHISSNANINGAKIAAASIPNTAFADPTISGGFAFVPIGGVIDYWSDGTVPAGWQVCDGSNVTDPVSALVGKTLPNLTATFTRGVPLSNLRSAANNGGEDTHLLTASEMPAHAHNVNDPGHAHTYQASINTVAGWSAIGAGPHPGDSLTASAVTNISIQNTGGGVVHNNIPAYVGMVKIIRIK